MDQHGVHAWPGRVSQAVPAGWRCGSWLVMTVVSVRIVLPMSATDRISSLPGPIGRGVDVDLAALTARKAPSAAWGEPDDLLAALRAPSAGRGPGAAETPDPAAWCRVRVHGPAGALDVALPTGRTVADLGDELAAHLLPGAPLVAAGEWRLHRVGQAALAPAAPFAAAHPRDGDVFHLTSAPEPEPARAVDDALDALGRAAGASGRWGPAGMTTAAATCAVGAAAALTAALALVDPAGAALPLLLAAGLLAAALVVRRESDGGEGARAVAAGAALPAWAGAGAALGHLLGVGASGTWALAGVGLAVGAAAAATAVPTLVPLWAAPAAAGALLAVGGALVGVGWLTTASAAAMTGTLVLLGTATAPWVVARSERWSSPQPPEGGEEEISALARRARGVLSAVSVVAAAAVAVCAVVLATGVGSGGASAGQVLMGRWLAVALAVVVVLRARRSRFSLDSGAMLMAGLLPLGVLGLVAVLLGGAGARWGVVAALTAALGVCVALVAVVRRAADGDDGPLARLTRPRVRRALGVLETLVAVSVLPLLLGVLGVYAAAADAGASL